MFIIVAVCIPLKLGRIENNSQQKWFKKSSILQIRFLQSAWTIVAFYFPLKNFELLNFLPSFLSEETIIVDTNNLVSRNHNAQFFSFVPKNLENYRGYKKDS